jgi:hypothetical protein
MAETKAPRNKSDLDPVSESWRKLPWRKLEKNVAMNRQFDISKSSGFHPERPD